MTIQRAVAEALDSLDEVFNSPPRSSEVSNALKQALSKASGPTYLGIPLTFIDQVSTLLESDRPASREDVVNLALTQFGLDLKSLRPYLLEERLRQRIEKVARKGGFEFVETSTGLHATKVTEGWNLEYTLRNPDTRVENEAVFSVGLSRKVRMSFSEVLKRTAAEDLGRRFGVSVKMPDDLGGDWVTAKGGYQTLLASIRRAAPHPVPEDTLLRCEAVEIANKATVEGTDLWFNLVVLRDDPADPEVGVELEVGVSSLLRSSWDQLKSLTVKGLEALR